MPPLHDILLVATAILVVMAPMTASFLQCWADRARNGARRMPNGRSYCDSCGQTLGVVDLVPVASWLWHRGSARCCAAPLSPALLWPEATALCCAIWAAWVSSLPLAVMSVALVWALQAIILLHETRADVAQGLVGVIALAGLGLAAGGLTGAFWLHLAGLAVGLAALAASHLFPPLLPFRDAATLLIASGALLGVTFLGVSLVICTAGAVAFHRFAPRLGLIPPSWPHALVFGTASGLWLTWLYGLAV